MNSKNLETFKDFINNDKVKQMKKYHMHGSIPVYNHVIHVCNVALLTTEKLKIKNVRYKKLIIRCLLHDYYLYNYSEMGLERYLHGHRHPYIALNNATKDFELNDVEENIIGSHMFPIHSFLLLNLKKVLF